MDIKPNGYLRAHQMESHIFRNADTEFSSEVSKCGGKQYSFRKETPPQENVEKPSLKGAFIKNSIKLKAESKTVEYVVEDILDKCEDKNGVSNFLIAFFKR